MQRLLLELLRYESWLKANNQAYDHIQNLRREINARNSRTPQAGSGAN